MNQFTLVIKTDAPTAQAAIDEINSHIEASQSNRDKWDDGSPFLQIELKPRWIIDE